MNEHHLPEWTLPVPLGPAWQLFEEAQQHAVALCAEVDPEAFYPPKNIRYSTRPVCGACELRIPCRDAARESNEQFGMWGGESPQERERFNLQAKEVA